MADLGNVATSMRGVITGGGEDGVWLANMTHPAFLTDVGLPVDALCMTRSYPNPNARTRLTRLLSPDLPVSVGALVVARVVIQTEETGEMVRNPAALHNWDQPTYIPGVRVVGASATRWGLVPKI